VVLGLDRLRMMETGRCCVASSVTSITTTCMVHMDGKARQTNQKRAARKVMPTASQTLLWSAGQGVSLHGKGGWLTWMMTWRASTCEQRRQKCSLCSRSPVSTTEFACQGRATCATQVMSYNAKGSSWGFDDRIFGLFVSRWQATAVFLNTPTVYC
jgi:hypothetical protein